MPSARTKRRKPLTRRQDRCVRCSKGTYVPVVWHDPDRSWIGHPPHDPTRFGLTHPYWHHWRILRCDQCGHCLFYLDERATIHYAGAAR